MSAGTQPTTEPRWFKSSYSGGNATECVECAYVSIGISIRDSKRADGPVISVRTSAWLFFLESLAQPQPLDR
ncbi:hypothetical protein AQJ11_00625 [Streptomyces corchorusii]|uniref:DUF397 domain-containing protein n=2 Tax=Streptomyces TaxID=1883 RepID=A0A124HPN7_STRCK|nr:DUF397 domain-containing protein [Streptomyces corchorusii]KUN32817.1 hypothetical protein AQJ11_00625 [Streptomyces corchorusii]